MSQKIKFLESEGDAYFDRNAKDADCSSDPVVSSAVRMKLKPLNVLEIGCGNGARLDCLFRSLGGTFHGIDPSSKAIEYARNNFPKHSFMQGTADELPYKDQQFDLVVFGCCLYLCDPADHFKIVFQADRVLKGGGFMIIKDFLPPLPYKNGYVHEPGMYSHKMHYSDLFCAHPFYRLLSREYLEHTSPFSFDPNERMSIDVLKKNTAQAFISNPYR
jgi:ubiquinone/menaquinone biosynthesis C-methylase UbiE